MTYKISEVWQREADRTCLVRVPGGWQEFGTSTVISDDDEWVGELRRLLDEEGRIASERLLGAHGLVVE